MAHPLAEGIAIELDRPRTLVCDFNALIEFQRIVGRNPIQGNPLEQVDPETIRALLWACLIHEDPDLTLEDVGRMITFRNFTYVANRLIEAWEAALPEDDGQEGESDPLAKAPAKRKPARARKAKPQRS